MAFLRWTLLCIGAVILTLLAVANREAVVLRLMPDELAVALQLPGPVSVPLFIVILGGILLGLWIGFLWEWMRERRHRREAVQRRREVTKLEREVDGLKKEQTGDRDDILALLE